MSKKKCKIINDKFSWIMEVDNRRIEFQGHSNADYLAKKFEELDYEIVWDRDKWERDE